MIFEHGVKLPRNNKTCSCGLLAQPGFVTTISGYSGCENAINPTDFAITPALVPENLRHLIPLVRKWAIGDDIFRAEALEAATPEEKFELAQALDENEDALMDYLTGSGAKEICMTDEYQAFSCFLQVADSTR